MHRHQQLLVLWLATAAGGCALVTDRSGSTSTSTPTATAPVVRGVAAADEVLDEAEAEPEQPPLKLQDFAPAQIGATVRRLTGRGPNRAIARQLYGEGEELYRQAVEQRDGDAQADVRGWFVEAAEKFAAAATRWPDSALEEDALFRAGESQFFADHYVKANHHFEQLLKKYPNTRYLDLVGARRFLIAQYWLKLHDDPETLKWPINLTDPAIPWSGTFGHAVRIYDRMRLDDPTGKLADDATMAAANAHFVKGDFEKADQYYSDVRTHFPSSEHQFHAHYLGIQAKLRGYRGANYTGTALEETEKLIQQVRRQFPHEARQQQEELDRAAREVRYLLAEREWRLAQYYARRQEYGAARIYFDTVVQDFGDTPFADSAREEIQRIAGKPRVPPQRLTWLVNLFPDADPTKPLLATSPSNAKRR
ncbi:MAG: outer membrane protein assembly factor BamD [Pirellulaceae bacterium]|jgi:outer membrane protein assembly factor BamD (BamD/ComL family)|nr:outer membrane protein assembly factor BamD [Pirellulaceae bacterium]